MSNDPRVIIPALENLHYEIERALVIINANVADAAKLQRHAALRGEEMVASGRSLVMMAEEDGELVCHAESLSAQSRDAAGAASVHSSSEHAEARSVLGRAQGVLAHWQWELGKAIDWRERAQAALDAATARRVEADAAEANASAEYHWCCTQTDEEGNRRFSCSAEGAAYSRATAFAREAAVAEGRARAELSRACSRVDSCRAAVDSAQRAVGYAQASASAAESACDLALQACARADHALSLASQSRGFQQQELAAATEMSSQCVAAVEDLGVAALHLSRSVAIVGGLQVCTHQAKRHFSDAMDQLRALDQATL